jgi:hypothetical protein
MAWDGTFAHFNVSQRSVMGWVDDDDIFSFDPATTPQSSVRLAPIETMSTGTDQHLGVEVRLADGWNYYWEYRLGQSGQVGDQQSPVPQGSAGEVLGTDHLDDPGQAGTQRRRIAFVPVEPGSDGPTLSAGQRFQQTDPLTPTELRVDVDSADSSEAVLSIDYDTYRPDPSIRPWPSFFGRWQSPDIEVFNEKNKPGTEGADEWRNVPWAGHKNDIVATVRNNGIEDAPGVQVTYFAYQFNANSGQELPPTRLGTVTKDVPAGGEVDVRLDGWIPPSERHHCIVAKIERYQLPSSSVTEQTETNNLARSNYSKYWSESSSPARRRVSTIAVANPYDKEAVIGLTVHQSHRDFRTYLEMRWVRLDPGETKDVRVLYEYAEPNLSAKLEELSGDYSGSNYVTLTSWGMPPVAPNPAEGTPEVLGGAVVEVSAGFKTRVNLEVVSSEAGRILGAVSVDAQSGSYTTPSGGVLVEIVPKNGGDSRFERASIERNGEFELITDLEAGEQVGVEYLGNFPYAPSQAGPERAQ